MGRIYYSTSQHGKWWLEGFDTFAGERYPLPGAYDSPLDALIAAHERFEELECIQPTASSGGQAGIQDNVYLVYPDGVRSRILTPGMVEGEAAERWASRFQDFS
jgi:hypothetical protein